MPTLFAAPKPFGGDAALVQRNAIAINTPAGARDECL